MDEYTYDTRYLDLITTRVRCDRHQAGTLDPCWTLPNGAIAICNRRAIRAGFVGRIKQSSLSFRSNKKRGRK
jgi:hypothetical protein